MNHVNLEKNKDYTFSEIESVCIDDLDNGVEANWVLNETGTGKTIGCHILLLQHCEKDEQMIFVLTGTRCGNFIYTFVHHSK